MPDIDNLAKKIFDDYGRKAQKAYVSVYEKISDLVPKIGPGVGPVPKRDFIRLLTRLKKTMERRITTLQLKVAGRDPKLRALITKAHKR